MAGGVAFPPRELLAVAPLLVWICVLVAWVWQSRRLRWLGSSRRLQRHQRLVAVEAVQAHDRGTPAHKFHGGGITFGTRSGWRAAAGRPTRPSECATNTNVRMHAREAEGAGGAGISSGPRRARGHSCSYRGRSRGAPGSFGGGRGHNGAHSGRRREPSNFPDIESVLDRYMDQRSRMPQHDLSYVFGDLAAARPPHHQRAQLSQDARFLQLVDHTVQAMPSLPARAMSNIAHRLARLSLPITEVLSAVDMQAERLVADGAPQDLSMAVWAYAKLGVQAPSLFAAVERQADRLAAEGSPQALANTAWAYARSGFQAPSIFAAVERQADRLAADGKPQELANTVWAFAKTGAKAPSLFAAVDREALRLVEQGSPQVLANVMWAYAKVGFRAPSLFKAVEGQAERLAAEGQPQNLANTVWACAKLGQRAPLLFDAVERQAERLAEHGKPQELANAVWAYAKLGVQAPLLFKAVEQQAARLAAQGSPQNLSNIVWAYATLGVQSPHVYGMVERQAGRLAAEGSTQALANTAWACAKSGMRSPSIFAAVEGQADRLAADGRSQELVNTMWACAKVGVQAPSLFAAVEREALRLASRGTTQELSNAVWACATLRVDAPRLFAAVEGQAARIEAGATPQELANTIWAYATQALDSPPLFAAVGAQAERLVQQGASVQNLTNIMWAYAAMPNRVSTMPKPVVARLTQLWTDGPTSPQHEDEWEDEGFHMIYQADLVAKDAGVDLGLPASLLARGRQVCQTLVERSSVERATRLQRDVAAQLRGMGCFNEEEHVTECRNFSIDVALVERRVAIEVNGPTHYIGRREDGRTQLRRRVLELRGWRVVSIPHFEWDVLDSSTDKQRYLEEKLGACSLGLANGVSIVTDAAVDCRGLKVVELKELLRARGLHVSGRKAELIERLGQGAPELCDDSLGDGRIIR